MKESLIEFGKSFRIGFLLGFFCAILIMYFYTVPKMIERRAQDLGIVRYSAKDYNFVVKDTIIINYDEWYYLCNGNFKRDFGK